MSITKKSSTLPRAASLLALAAVAACLGGSASHASRPLPVAAIAVMAPAVPPAVAAATPHTLPATSEAANETEGDDQDDDTPPTLEPIPAAIPESGTLQVAAPQGTQAPHTQAVSFQSAPATGALAPIPGDLAALRARLHWMSVQVNGRELRTPDPASRLLLVRSAAERARLADVGLDFRDVYGVITAETSWVPRTGMGRNGVASQGLAQLEPATARALGVRDANDPVEAVQAAARLLREAGAWSARRLAGLRLSEVDRAVRLREGISVYYNLSSHARQRWNGLTHTLPLETRRHIFNVRAGIAQAERLQTGVAPSAESLLAEASAAAQAPTSATPAVQHVASRRVAPVAAHPVGTISWSGHGGDAQGRRAGTHVVWSNGVVTHDGGRVHWTSHGRG
jgi:hypothetical protein